jgi:hypothetical protein
MTRIKSYYINSSVTKEYIDNEVLEVQKCSGSKKNKRVALDGYKGPH